MHSSPKHHLFVRRRMYKNLEVFPHTNEFKQKFDHFMYVIAILGPLSMLPQLYETFTTHNVQGMSFLTWALWVALSFVWFVYGILHKEIPIIISQGIYFVFNAIILVAMAIYV